MTTHLNKVETTLIEEKTVSVTCDHCGVEMLLPHALIKGGRVEISSLGYGSEYDLQHWNFDICVRCTHLLLDFFDEYKRQLSKKAFIPLKRCD